MVDATVWGTLRSHHGALPHGGTDHERVLLDACELIKACHPCAAHRLSAVTRPVQKARMVDRSCSSTGRAHSFLRSHPPTGSRCFLRTCFAALLRGGVGCPDAQRRHRPRTTTLTLPTLTTRPHITAHQISKCLPRTRSTLPSSTGKPSSPRPTHSCLETSSWSNMMPISHTSVPSLKMPSL